MDLDIHQYLTKATERKDPAALRSAYSLIKDTTAAGSGQRSFHIASELYVLCAEAALQLGCLDISTACLKMYFEGNPPANQLLCRAYLCNGQLKSPSTTGSMKDFEEAVMCFLKAIDISKHDPRYNFMVFNASVMYFQAARPLLQPYQRRRLVSSLRQVVQSLEEVAHQDHSWRAELMMYLISCLVDSGKMEEAADFAKITEEFIKSHTPQLYSRLFTLMVQHKLSKNDVLVETSRQSVSLEVIYKIQGFKNSLKEMNEGELKKEDSAKLEEIFHLLVNSVQPVDRVAFLLELALLALQVKHQKVAAGCLKELNTLEEASVGQRILMECVNCGINLLRKEAKMNDYCKASVEAQLKEIGKLDKLLQTAVRESLPQAVQAVCATQWSFCLPLLQHNLRKHIKAPLLRMAHVLEDTQSTMLGMRCQIHSELAALEEEEGRLEAASTHLHKAMLLDDGSHRQRLSSAFHLLQLRKTLYQTPSRNEDKAALLLQQAKEIQPQDKTDIRPILVAVGLLLAPDDFQMVLDADDTSKIVSPPSGPVAELCAKAQHHAACVQRVDRHLTTQGDESDNAERVKLWAVLAKTARKREVWDVCRAASRFCLLYDDGRWKMAKNDKDSCSEEESLAERHQGCTENQPNVKDLLQLLAEIRFITAEATVQKLLTEGVKLNSPAAPPQERGVRVSEDSHHWLIYKDWIQALSAHATSNFLRAAELGVEINQPWVVANAAVYLWNYNSHLLAAAEYQHLVPTFHRLVGMLRNIEFTRNQALMVLLCDAVARGLIQPLCGANYIEPPPQADQGKNRAEKGTEKAASSRGDPAALQDVYKALELCEYALHLPSCSKGRQNVSIAVRKQVVATWVQIKRLLKQQIGSNIDIKDKSEDEDVSAMTRVLVVAEMLQCNRNPKHMEFTVPSLSTLLSMASECSWTDAAVELQVWCQLAAFCYDVKDHSLVLCCTEKALQLEEAATKSLTTVPYALYSLTAVKEMLSSAACLRGLSLGHESRGDLHTYKEALKMLLFAVSNAEKADNPALCITAARHYWNTCLPLTQIPVERWQLQKPLDKILTALVHTNCTHTNKQGKAKRLLTLAAMPSGRPKDGAKADEEDLSLRANIYSFLAQLHVELKDWKSALQLLDKGISDVSCARHQVPLLKQRILVKVRLGENIVMDMQKLRGKDELCCSLMWHQAALCSAKKAKQLTYYQEAITSAICAETQKCQMVGLLIEFGAWLYCHNFPKADAQHQLQWAIDVLLNLDPEQAEGAVDNSKRKDLSSGKCELSVGVQFSSWIHNLSNLKEVWRLDCLIQAHTLLAVMTDKTSPEHQLHLLRAYTFALQVWKVSMAVATEISSDMAKCQPPQSAGSRKDQDKGKSKKSKDPTPAEERSKPMILDPSLPSAVKEWARYVCPDQARQIFRTNSNPHCINRHSITKQTRCLFYLNRLENELCLLSLDHLTLPVLHLAETIACDLLDDKGLSDLYRLRIVRTCWHLGVEANLAYQEKLLHLSSVQEQKQMRCRNVITLSQERGDVHKPYRQNTGVDKDTWSWQDGSAVHSQDIWLDKAEVCLGMGLYQPARQLLTEAHLMAVELGDLKALARCLLGLSILACEEQNYAQALMLLDKAQALGGDKEFWYHFTFTKVRAVVGQSHQDAQTKAEVITKQGCEALKLNLEQRAIQGPELTFMIISLEMRGAMECICAITGSELGGGLSSEALQRLTASCDKLRDCAVGFDKLSYKEQAAEAHAEYAHALGILSTHTADPDNKRLLLDGLSHMQLAVTLQEHVAQRIQDLLNPEEESHDLPLPAMRKLLRLRLASAEFCLVMLEKHCTEKKNQAASRIGKTSVEMALEDFTRCTPEPGSLEQEWVSVGRALGQVALSQLAAVSSHPLVNTETRARCLTQMGTYLRLQAVHEDPIHMCFLWSRSKQEAHSEHKPIFIKEGNSEKDGESGRKETRVTSAKRAELQQSRCKAQQLLAQASKALTEATGLCLQHNLPFSVLADASLSMLECHGQSNPAVAGQYLALFQSCCTASTIAEVLGSACADTSVSQFSALLSLHRNLPRAQEESPGSMLRGVEDSLNSLSKAFSHLTISPHHLNILAELPPNLKILLLQHTNDGSELYGAFYETTKESDSPKGKTGILTCSRVAKVSVCPQALGALRKKTQAFGQEARHALVKEGCWPMEVTAEHQETAAEEKLERHFREIVQDMEDYMNPLLEQFDFSCLRLKALSVPETSRIKEKEEKPNSTKVKLPEECGTSVVLLADRKLLELPLEALSILQEGGLSSVSRDFSLQLLHSRLNKEEPQIVERDNKKETSGARGTKEKGDQSQAIKVMTANRTLPSNACPVDARNFKCIFMEDASSLCAQIEEMLESHRQHFTHPSVGNKHKLSVSEMEQLLCRCSAFIYVGTERFTENIPLSKVAALSLRECRMALLFDRIQIPATRLHQSNGHMYESTGKLALEETLETALLLSVVGVGCVVLNQWHCSFQKNTRDVAAVLDNMLRSSHTSGQSIQALRKRTGTVTLQEHQSHDQALFAEPEEDHAQHKMTHSPFNCVLYGLPNLIVI